MWLLYCAWRYGGQDPYKLYNRGEATPPCPQPWRLRMLIYAMSIQARNDEMAMHGVTSEGAKKREPTGTTIRMPGGREGVK